MCKCIISAQKQDEIVWLKEERKKEKAELENE